MNCANFTHAFSVRLYYWITASENKKKKLQCSISIIIISIEKCKLFLFWITNPKKFMNAALRRCLNSNLWLENWFKNSNFWLYFFFFFVPRPIHSEQKPKKKKKICISLDFEWINWLFDMKNSRISLHNISLVCDKLSKAKKSFFSVSNRIQWTHLPICRNIYILLFI